MMVSPNQDTTDKWLKNYKSKTPVLFSNLARVSKE